jgi:hypothetical protein
MVVDFGVFVAAWCFVKGGGCRLLTLVLHNNIAKYNLLYFYLVLHLHICLGTRYWRFVHRIINCLLKHHDIWTDNLVLRLKQLLTFRTTIEVEGQLFLFLY